MTTVTRAAQMQDQRMDWVAVARELGPGFAARAAAHDANDSFPLDNYGELRERRVLSAAIPTELGGGGATYAELCAMLREFGRHCSGTALALSMHTHLVATSVYLWRQGAPVADNLRQIAEQQLVLVTTSASDWLNSNGVTERVEGGFRVSAHKHFASGSPAGDLLLTSAPYDDPVEGAQVLHFTVPMSVPGLRVLDNWRTLGMRASGSNDILLDGVFVPDAAVQKRRARGVWDPFYNIVAGIAAPVVSSVYLGVAEAARDLALRQVAGRRENPELWYLVGELENALTTGRLAVESMVAIQDEYRFVPSEETASALFARKTIAAEAFVAAVEKAMEAVGGAGMMRSLGLERLLRDIHAGGFHPLPAKRQHRFTGRLALGLDPNDG